MFVYHSKKYYPPVVEVWHFCDYSANGKAYHWHWTALDRVLRHLPNYGSCWPDLSCTLHPLLFGKWYCNSCRHRKSAEIGSTIGRTSTAFASKKALDWLRLPFYNTHS